VRPHLEILIVMRRAGHRIVVGLVANREHRRRHAAEVKEECKILAAECRALIVENDLVDISAAVLLFEELDRGAEAHLYERRVVVLGGITGGAILCARQEERKNNQENNNVISVSVPRPDDG